ncbi:hypothetical protein OJ997_05740 [Solirubrobacter phytolaccae]|uniref:Uncharacterized protein n=1 Tax=Solirubrobacter phytolaccae TaxID=1404360 RepID=A0A9X3NBN8_9ACTN|nr:hypothetical protein [Solirubrobacter phytolaccae]MDA0179787.1 hypothetical protein [Solirubrobacter phytolaccae]
MPGIREYWWGLPALLVGVVAMIQGDVASSRPAANVAFFLLGFGAVLLMRRATVKPGAFTGGVLCLVLLATFLGGGNDGVHRWIDAGPLSLDVSMLVAPWVLAVMAHLLARGRVAGAVALAVLVQLALLLQPDAAQGSAFAAGAVVLLLMSAERSGVVLTGVAAVVAMALGTFSRRDPLAPVPEVEGIVGLARDAAPWLGVAAVVACALLAVPFVRAALHGRSAREPVVGAAQAALCAYVVVQLLAPLGLDVPVPVMGYGAATVLAYAAAFTASLAMPRDRAFSGRSRDRAAVRSRAGTRM